MYVLLLIINKKIKKCIFIKTLCVYRDDILRSVPVGEMSVGEVSVGELSVGEVSGREYAISNPC